MDADTKMQAEGTWEQFRGTLQEKWGEFTDDEWQEMKGHWNQFVGTIRRKTGETAESIERKFDEMFDRRDENV